MLATLLMTKRYSSGNLEIIGLKKFLGLANWMRLYRLIWQSEEFFLHKKFPIWTVRSPSCITIQINANIAVGNFHKLNLNTVLVN